jgi:hypothetical protein
MKAKGSWKLLLSLNEVNVASLSTDDIQDIEVMDDALELALSATT